MNYKQITAVAALLLSCAIASADEQQALTPKPAIHTSSTTQITAVVEAINHETREVTAKRADGEIIEFVASEEARNLDQVAVGDIIHARYVESMSIEVVANDGYEPAAGGVATVARSEKGEMPGMVATDTQIVTATVEEINLENNTFKLKGPLGNINEFTARDPENLKRAEVGDLVVITTTEGMAISVEKGSAE
jgi:hypothetical protein